MKLWKDSTNSALDFNDNSKLFLIGQAFGVYDISKKARNGKYNTLNRTYSKIAMGAHTLANYAVTPRVLLSILHDNKVIDGKIQTRQQYLQEGLRKGEDQKSILAKWKLEDNFIYNHMDFTENGFKWKGEFIDGVHKPTGLSKEYLEGRKLTIQKSIGERVSSIEGQMPQGFRMQAQRHAMMSTVLLHKSFLSIVGSNRLRDRHFNIATQMKDEGTWRTAADVFGEFFNTKGNFKKKVEGLKNSMRPPEKPKRGDFDNETTYKQALKEYPSKVLDAELRNRNMKRLSIEVGAYAALALIISTAMLVTDDDEDQGYFSSAANLLMMRTLNESATNLSFNMIGDIGDTIESPVVIYQSAAKISKVWEAFDFREIENGRYKGINRNTRYMMNLVPGMKNIYDLKSANNINSARQTYELYNKNAILNASTFGVMPLFDSFREN